MRGLAVFGAMALALAVSPVSATVMNFMPTADGDVQTHGGTVINTTGGAVGITQSGALIKNGIFEFDLSSIPDASTINSVTLMVELGRFISNVGSGPAEIDIIAYNGDGVIDVADFDAAGTQVVDTNTPSAGTGGGDMLSFTFTDVTPVFDALAGNLLTLRVETDSFASIQFAALESNDYNPAKLTVDYSAVPVPGALVFGLTALAGLALTARRKA